ncbi:MAG: four helix bundle protein [bacterium]
MEVWKNSVQLVTEICKLTKSFPKEEIYELSSKIAQNLEYSQGSVFTELEAKIIKIRAQLSGLIRSIKFPKQ